MPDRFPDDGGRERLLCRPSAVWLPAARAQTVTSCQTTTTPPLLPIISDSTPGWSAKTSGKRTALVGDIDGDGNDELVMLVQGQVQIWHWTDRLDAHPWRSAKTFVRK